MRLLKSSPFRAILVAIISFSLILSLSFSLRLTGVSADQVKDTAPPPASAKP